MVDTELGLVTEQAVDRRLIERRDRQQAAIRASNRVMDEVLKFQKGDRDRLTGEELTSIIFEEFENV